MTRNPNVKLNNKAFRALRMSPEVRAEVVRAARKVADRDPGYAVDVRNLKRGRGRVRASVRTATDEARRAQADDPGKLLRDLEAARD